MWEISIVACGHLIFHAFDNCLSRSGFLKEVRLGKKTVSKSSLEFIKLQA